MNADFIEANEKENEILEYKSEYFLTLVQSWCLNKANKLAVEMKENSHSIAKGIALYRLMMMCKKVEEVFLIGNFNLDDFSDEENHAFYENAMTTAVFFRELNEKGRV
jgi:hypothetical protein